ncbi:MAG: EAL domain-containing protein [Hyphomicrobiaceae bacterium]
MDRLTILATHALSSAIFGFALIQHGGVDVALGALSGAVAFLCLRYLHDTFSLAREKREMTQDLSSVWSAAMSLRGSLDDTKRNVSELTVALARRADTYEKKVAAELKAIERALGARPHPSQSSPARGAAAPLQAVALPDQAMLEVIQRALNQNRVDIYLQPIVSLPHRKIRFYEGLTRLRSADGSIVMPAQYMNVAAPAGLMPPIDNLLLLRCVQLVRRLSQKNRDIAVFCNLSEQTLTDAEFFPQLLEFLRGNRDICSHIVFEFAQETMLKASRAVDAGIAALHQLGFRLSLDQVSTLNCDFAKLRQQGFRFVKIKARTLLLGMQHASAPAAAEAFKDLLTRNGVTLIVERVESESTVAQLLEYNIGYGQGFLFGEPRPLRDVGEIHDRQAMQPGVAIGTHSATVPARRLKS